MAIFFYDPDYVLRTTGQTLVGKDIGVGFLGFLAIASLIVGIGNLIAFLKFNKTEENGRAYSGLKKASKKYLLDISIFFLAFCVISVIINVLVCCLV